MGFLVSLALLASLLLLACVAATAVMWFGWTPHGEPPATLHFATAPFPYAVGGVVVVLLLLLVRSCHSSSDLCSGTLPLVMMMPGASVGVGLLELSAGGRERLGTASKQSVLVRVELPQGLPPLRTREVRNWLGSLRA